MQEEALNQLLLEIQNAIEEPDLERTTKLIETGLSIYGNRSSLLVLKANLSLELGEWDLAYKILKEVINTDNNCAEAYMGLAQMTVEKESASYYQKGIEIYLSKAQSMSSDSVEIKDLQRKISEGFIALTELYLTDLCFEPDAEVNCENYLSKAVQIDPNNPVIYQTLASVRLSQNRTEQGKECLLTALNMWYGKEEVTPPPFQTRLNLIRMFLETQMMDNALQVLEHIQKEDDTNVDGWYLFGLASFLMAQTDDVNVQLEHFKDSWECFLSAEKFAAQNQYDDEAVLQHIAEMKQEILDKYPQFNNYQPEEDAPLDHEPNFDTDEEEDMQD